MLSPAAAGRAALVRWVRVEGAVRALAVSATSADLVVAHQACHLPADAPTTLQLITVNGHTAACRTAHGQVSIAPDTLI